MTSNKKCFIRFDPLPLDDSMWREDLITNAAHSGLSLLLISSSRRYLPACFRWSSLNVLTHIPPRNDLCLNKLSCCCSGKSGSCSQWFWAVLRDPPTRFHSGGAMMHFCYLFCYLAAQTHLLRFKISEEPSSNRTVCTHGWCTLRPIHLYTYTLDLCSSLAELFNF